MSDFLNNFIDDKLDLKKNTIKKHQRKEEFLKDDTLTIIFKYKDVTEEVQIPKFKKNINLILNKSIILYGPSGSGKTSIVRDFMHLTKKCFPMVFAFVPTNAEKHDYDSLIPKPLVYESFSLKEIKEIYVRQKITTEIYNNANNIKTLYSLFNRVADDNIKHYHDKLTKLKKKAIKTIEETTKSITDKKVKTEQIEDIFKNEIIGLYKIVIKKNINDLHKMNLTQEEKFALRYIGLNPRTLVLFDDALVEVMKLIRDGQKTEDETIKNFFFKGRWANITHWYAFQDDCKLNSDIRKNAFISIFTDKQVAMGFFKRPANSFTPLEQKRAEAVINTVFSEETAPKFAKLIYSRLDKNKFYYIVADEHPDSDIQMCSDLTRAYCQKIENENDKFDVTNPYYQKFKDNL